MEGGKGNGGEGRGDEGGGRYSFVACLRHLVIRHTSLSRRSTVPTSNSTLFPYRNFSLISSPSCLAACGYHLLSPIDRMSIVFSLSSSSEPNSSVSYSSIFLISFTSRLVHFTFSHYVSFNFNGFATGADLCIYLGQGGGGQGSGGRR